MSYPWYSTHGWGPVAGAVVGTISAITSFATIDPDSIAWWVTIVGGGAFALANYGILIYHRIGQARRDEYLKWLAVQAKTNRENIAKLGGDAPKRVGRSHRKKGPD